MRLRGLLLLLDRLGSFELFRVIEGISLLGLKGLLEL